MIKIEYKIIVTIAALASILVVNTVAIGTDGHIALARHYDKTNVFKNSHINVQTDTDQSQGCETAGGTSPISNSCTASSSNTISQGTPPASTSPSCPTIHPTALTIGTTTPAPGFVQFTGKLTDTCTGSGVGGSPITFTLFGGVHIPDLNTVTNAAGSYTSPSFLSQNAVGPAQAHFAGSPGLGPSNSATIL